MGDLNESWQRSQQLQTISPAPLEVLSGVTQWQLYFFRGNAWSNCQSSAGTGDPSTPPASGGGTPPIQQAADPLKALRIVLSFGEGSGFSGSVTRDIALGPQ